MSTEPTFPLSCPVCSQPLILEDRTWQCDAGHRFDQAREGYVNLHLAQHKRSKEPGDNREMVEARRLFLGGGHYDPLIDAIAKALDELGDMPDVLDAGCGEGSYLRRMLDRGVSFGSRMGLDVSKIAVRLAAKADREGLYMVASSFDLPLADESVDTVLRVFAPGNAAEALRVLRPGGLYLIATPGPQHLMELKRHIYDQPHEHKAFDARFDGFEEAETREISYPFVLNDSESIAALLAMTPYYWRASEEVQASMREIENLELNADFRLHVLRKPT